MIGALLWAAAFPAAGIAGALIIIWWLGSEDRLVYLDSDEYDEVEDTL